MSNASFRLYILQCRMYRDHRLLWMFGIKAPPNKGCLIFLDPDRNLMPIQIDWTTAFDICTKKKEHILSLSTSQLELMIGLIKTVRAGDNKTWMYQVLIALRTAGHLAIETSRRWLAIFEPQESFAVAEAPSVTTPPTDASPVVATSTATPSAAPEHAAGVPTAQSPSAGLSRPEHVASGKPTAETTTAPRHPAGQGPAAEPPAQPAAPPSRASPPTAATREACGPVTAAVISTVADRAKLRALPGQQPQGTPAAPSSSTPYPSHPPSGSRTIDSSHASQAPPSAYVKRASPPAEAAATPPAPKRETAPAKPIPSPPRTRKRERPPPPPPTRSPSNRR